MLGVLLSVVTLPVYGAPRKHVIVDGNRTRAVHTIPLYDENYETIRPDDDRPMPFSTRNTCGDCHDYEKITMGWHFDSSKNITDPGRPGEPWVLVDEGCGVQLPISYRGWAGTWKPQDIGMTDWDFAKAFGRHMPGGDVGDKDDREPDPKARWNVSGNIEINCLACHNASADQNQSEWAVQMGRENFRWAATAASGLGVVLNMASRLPEYYDLIDGPNKDNRWAAVPEVDYANHRFNRKSCVFFDVNRNPPNNRCYYCHSSVPRNVDPNKVWAWDGDVHLLAGLICTDCHRNGLDHFVSRGYEGENSDPAYSTLTCRGCHLGDSAGQGFEFKGGRMAAPRPLHRGLPAVHLEKLSCTACHSGFLPGDKTERVRTARANRLGIHGRAQWDTELPYIMAPVFVRNANDKIEPHEIMWPAFWGGMKGEKVTPLSLDVVAPIVTALRDAEAEAKQEIERQKEEAAAPQQKPQEAAQTPKQEGESSAEAGAAPPEGQAEVAESPETGAAPGQSKGEGEGEGEGEELEKREEEIIAEIIAEETAPLTENQVAKVLTDLATQIGPDQQPVYVAGGTLYKLAAGGNALAAMNHPSAAPYSWAFAHDVRPASQSLGARGCSDCHDENSNFFFGNVEAASPLPLGPPVSTPMYAMTQLDPTLLAALDIQADLRTPFIIAAIVMAIVLALALLHSGLHGLEGFLRLFVATGGKK